MECCNAPSPAPQKTSSYSELCRVFYLLVALHHVIMPSCHLIFATHLNKLYGSSVHLNRGIFTMVISLYNISSQYLGSYIKPFHNTFARFFKFPFYPTQLLFFLWCLFSKIELQFYFIHKCSKSAHKSHLVCRAISYNFNPFGVHSNGFRNSNMSS